jgi:transcriptional regulator with XRE-family HTH domain
MPNERLRGAISAAGQTLDRLAEAVQVDPKTVERWVTKDRVPHRSTRLAVADLLSAKETYLWPSVADDPRTKSASRAELVEFYASRSSVPLDLWVSMAEAARECFDLLAFAGLFLPEHVELVPRLIRRARAGVRVRVLLGDPDSPAVALRGQEEGLHEGMSHRIRLSMRYFAEAHDVAGLEVRLHATTLYASIFRSDGAALVNTHVYGAPAAQSPVLHLQRVPGGRVFDHYMTSFDRVWSTAKRVDAVSNQ